MVADYAWGQSFKSALEDASKSAPNIRFQIQVVPLPTQNHALPACVRRREPDRGDGASAGAGLILAQSGQLGIKAPVIGAYSPYSLTAKNARAAAYGRWSDFKCMATGTGHTRPSRSATCGRSRRTSSSRTTRSPATRT